MDSWLVRSQRSRRHEDFLQRQRFATQVLGMKRLYFGNHLITVAVYQQLRFAPGHRHPQSTGKFKLRWSRREADANLPKTFPSVIGRHRQQLPPSINDRELIDQSFELGDQ